MIRKMEDGSGVGFAVVVYGKVVNFKLAVFAHKGWEDYEEFEFGFISEDNRYARSTYPGGITGMGISNYELNNKVPKDMRLVTTDLEEINKLAEKMESEAKEKEENFRKKQNKKVEKINSLPTEFSTGIEKLDGLVVFEREEASFNPSQSRSIQGKGVSLLTISGENRIFLSDYIARGGRLKMQAFEREAKIIFGDKAFELDLRETLKALVARRNELNQMIERT